MAGSRDAPLFGALGGLELDEGRLDRRRDAPTARIACFRIMVCVSLLNSVFGSCMTNANPPCCGFSMLVLRTEASTCFRILQAVLRLLDLGTDKYTGQFDEARSSFETEALH